MKQLKPNYAPIYAAALYPDLAAIFQKHGYALAAHGSLARDFDLIAVPWIEKPSEVKDILNEVTKTFHIKIIGKPETKYHDRLVYTLSIGFGRCAIDLSFMPKYETF